MLFKRLLLLLLLCCCNAQANDLTVYTIYVDDGYKPYSYDDNGKARGVYNDILRQAIKNLPDFKVKLHAVPWNRGKHLMQQGKGFALAPAYFHGHDWSYLYPYSHPIYEETVAVYCNENQRKTEGSDWPADYTGKVIGSIIGYDGWGGEEFRNMVAKKEVSLHEVNTAENLIMMLAAGRNDCILMERFAFAYQMRKLRVQGIYDDNEMLKIYEMAIAGVDPVYIGYSEVAIASGSYKKQYEFRKSMDAILYQMRKSGEIDRIFAEYKNK